MVIHVNAQFLFLTGIVLPSWAQCKILHGIYRAPMELKRHFAGMGEMCRGQCSEHFNWCVPIYIIVNSVGWELVLGGANASRVTWHHRLSWNIVTNHVPLIMN